MAWVASPWSDLPERGTPAYSRSRYWMVRGEMPRISAALMVAPPTCSSVFKIAWRSSSAMEAPGTTGPEVVTGCTTWVVMVGMKSWILTSSPRQTTTARSTAFSSSRTLPGHE